MVDCLLANLTHLWVKYVISSLKYMHKYVIFCSFTSDLAHFIYSMSSFYLRLISLNCFLKLTKLRLVLQWHHVIFVEWHWLFYCYFFRRLRSLWEILYQKCHSGLLGLQVHIISGNVFYCSKLSRYTYLYWSILNICIPVEGDDSGARSQCLDPSAEGWIADCFSDADLNFSNEDLYVFVMYNVYFSFCLIKYMPDYYFAYNSSSTSGASDIQINISGNAFICWYECQSLRLYSAFCPLALYL